MRLAPTFHMALLAYKVRRHASPYLSGLAPIAREQVGDQFDVFPAVDEDGDGDSSNGRVRTHTSRRSDGRHGDALMMFSSVWNPLL